MNRLFVIKSGAGMLVVDPEKGQISSLMIGGREYIFGEAELFRVRMMDASSRIGSAARDFACLAVSLRQRSPSCHI